MNNIQLDVRAATHDDDSFIFNSWLKSYRNSEFAKDMVNDVYFSNHKAIIQKLLESDSTVCTLLVNPDDYMHYYGYVCYTLLPSSKILHYVYVKYNYRKFGLAKRLLNAVLVDDKPNIITHIPRNFNKLHEKYNLIYNPYILTDL